MEPGLAQTQGIAPNKVVPLLAGLSRLEELASAIVMRLDPITNHTPTAETTKLTESNTVTARINRLGDSLQYLLDNIEL